MAAARRESNLPPTSAKDLPRAATSLQQVWAALRFHAELVTALYHCCSAICLKAAYLSTAMQEIKGDQCLRERLRSRSHGTTTVPIPYAALHHCSCLLSSPAAQLSTAIEQVTAILLEETILQQAWDSSIA